MFINFIKFIKSPRFKFILLSKYYKFKKISNNNIGLFLNIK